MSRPELPKSRLGGGRPEWVHWLELAAVILGAWEAVWLVLLLAGDSPQGQIWSVPGRWMAMAIRAQAQHLPTAGGWIGAEWGVYHPVALGPVILVVLGLLIFARVAVHLITHGLPTREKRPPKGSRGGGGEGRQRPIRNASEVNMSMEEWLAKQAAGQRED